MIVRSRVVVECVDECVMDVLDGVAREIYNFGTHSDDTVKARWDDCTVHPDVYAKADLKGDGGAFQNLL